MTSSGSAVDRVMNEAHSSDIHVRQESVGTSQPKRCKMAEKNSGRTADIGSFFALNEDDSSDDEPTCTNPKRRTAAQELDLESLFEFDTGALVQIASRACGKQPDSFWDCSAMQGACSAEKLSESDELILRLMNENEQKDKQIEVLKRTVCELLVWKSTWSNAQSGNLGASSLPARKLGVKGKMRAEAPEFVSLGIQGDASDVRTNPVKFISEGIHDHTPQPSPRGARGSGPLTPRGLTGLRADAPEFVSLGIPSLIAQPTVMSCMSCQSPEEEKIMRGAKQRTPRGAWNTADAAGSGAKTRKNDKDGGESMVCITECNLKSETTADVKGVQTKMKGAC